MLSSKLMSQSKNAFLVLAEARNENTVYNYLDAMKKYQPLLIFNKIHLLIHFVQ